MTFQLSYRRSRAIEAPNMHNVGPNNSTRRETQISSWHHRNIQEIKDDANYEYELPANDIFTAIGLDKPKQLEGLIEDIEKKFEYYVVLLCFITTGSFLVIYFLCWPVTKTCCSCCSTLFCMKISEELRKEKEINELQRVAKSAGIALPIKNIVEKAIERLDKENIQHYFNKSRASPANSEDELISSESTTLLKDID